MPFFIFVVVYCRLKRFDNFLTIVNIHTLPGGLAVKTTTVEGEPGASSTSIMTH